MVNQIKKDKTHFPAILPGFLQCPSASKYFVLHSESIMYTDPVLAMVREFKTKGRTK